jgi:hypothetical protein
LKDIGKDIREKRGMKRRMKEGKEWRYERNNSSLKFNVSFSGE